MQGSIRELQWLFLLRKIMGHWKRLFNRQHNRQCSNTSAVESHFLRFQRYFLDSDLLSLIWLRNSLITLAPDQVHVGEKSPSLLFLRVINVWNERQSGNITSINPTAARETPHTCMFDIIMRPIRLKWKWLPFTSLLSSQWAHSVLSWPTHTVNGQSVSC